jgi:hypothetical protein
MFIERIISLNSSKQGVGATDGTICNSGQMCFKGKCLNNTQAPVGNCLYGDDYVTNNDIGNILNLTSTTILTCSSMIQSLISRGYDPAFFCQNKKLNFGKSCCQTCSSIIN